MNFIMWELYLRKLIFKNLPVWDLLGGPVVKNLPSKKRKEESAFQNRGHEKKKKKTGDMVQFLVGELRLHMPRGS